MQSSNRKNLPIWYPPLNIAITFEPIQFKILRLPLVGDKLSRNQMMSSKKYLEKSVSYQLMNHNCVSRAASGFGRICRMQGCRFHNLWLLYFVGGGNPIYQTTLMFKLQYTIIVPENIVHAHTWKNINLSKTKSIINLFYTCRWWVPCRSWGCCLPAYWRRTRGWSFWELQSITANYSSIYTWIFTRPGP